MAEFVETACKSFTAGGAIAQYLRVKLSAGVLAAAGSTDRDIGVMEWPALAANDVVAVRLRTAQGTCKMVADGVIEAGADVYCGASGKVSGSGTVLRGTALEAAATNGDVIEVLQGTVGT